MLSRLQINHKYITTKHDYPFLTGGRVKTGWRQHRRDGRESHRIHPPDGRVEAVAPSAAADGGGAAWAGRRGAAGLAAALRAQGAASAGQWGREWGGRRRFEAAY